MESKKYTTLLVDEELEDVELFRRCFEDSHVQHVHDKDKILSSILEFRPDIVFLDTHLSKDSTLDCLKVIKSHPQVCHIPVVIYATPTSSEEVRKCFLTGAMRYLVKPIDARGLLFGLQIITYLLRAGSFVCTDPEEFLINTNNRYFVY